MQTVRSLVKERRAVHDFLLTVPLHFDIARQDDERRLLQDILELYDLIFTHVLIADIHQHIALTRRHGVVAMPQLRAQTSELHSVASHAISVMTFSSLCSAMKASICSTVCIAFEQLWLATTIAACAVPCCRESTTDQPSSRP